MHWIIKKRCLSKQQRPRSVCFGLEVNEPLFSLFFPHRYTRKLIVPITSKYMANGRTPSRRLQLHIQHLWGLYDGDKVVILQGGSSTCKLVKYGKFCGKNLLKKKETWSTHLFWSDNFLDGTISRDKSNDTDFCWSIGTRFRCLRTLAHLLQHFSDCSLEEPMMCNDGCCFFRQTTAVLLHTLDNQGYNSLDTATG